MAESETPSSVTHVNLPRSTLVTMAFFRLLKVGRDLVRGRELRLARVRTSSSSKRRLTGWLALIHSTLLEKLA